MEVLATRIMEHGNRLPEGTPVVAKELLHLGSRAAVDQALSRLVRRGTLMRAARGIYVRPVESRFWHHVLPCGVQSRRSHRRSTRRERGSARGCRRQ